MHVFRDQNQTRQSLSANEDTELLPETSSKLPCEWKALRAGLSSATADRAARRSEPD